MNTHQTADLEYGQDTYGDWAEIFAKGEQAEATQLLRWIKPGTFLMGSPEDEQGRYEDEGPQHKVTLTQGYWIADTACTQALWMAVMGSNPSWFKGDPQRPVEQVSWQDVQEFLRKLERLLSRPWVVALPSEAEWEYACRAGTDTPFSLGECVTSEQANHSGRYPYAESKGGLSPQQTVPVKRLPANAWGLYQMHGNVWEWCADGLRTYSGEAQVDPRCCADWRRAVRGGSWYDLQESARCAARHYGAPDYRYSHLGFRFCLR